MDASQSRKFWAGIYNMGLIQVIDAAVGILVSVFLYRYYGPEVIGIWAIAIAIVGVGDSLLFSSDVALNTFIPRYVVRTQVLHMWYAMFVAYLLNSVTLVLTAIIVFLSSCYVGNFYRNNTVALLLKILSLGYLLRIFGGL